jgi:hypothetical protein
VLWMGSARREVRARAAAAAAVCAAARGRDLWSRHRESRDHFFVFVGNNK